MLSREDNEKITRVGPGTPGGELFRRYWIPACLTSELGQPDDPPVRVRLLGEDLIAYRDTKGRPALLDAIARIVARRCFSAATRIADCAASITAGSST